MKFRDDFVWGAATSSYQIEGGQNEGGKGAHLWDEYVKEENGKVFENQRGDVSCDHYHRYKEDVQLMKELGITPHKFRPKEAIAIMNGTAAMNVYGRFTPATDYFYGCTLQDGATLDLNGRNGAWSTTSAFTSGANHVTFASGATITVDVSTRPTFKGKIVDWGAGNTPSDVTFKLDAASKAMGRALRVKDDGLYAVGGVILIMR